MLKINHILSASLLASAVILSGTACAASSIPEGRNTPTTATADATASAESTYSADATDSTEDTAKILTTVNGYYDFITSPNSDEKIKTAAADLVGKAATDKQLQAFAEDFSEGFQYFDTSDSTLIKRAYTVMSGASLSLQAQGSITISIPADAVTVDGDTATVNTTWISATKNGKKLGTAPESYPDESDLTHLVKKDDGSWVIVANTAKPPKPTVP